MMTKRKMLAALLAGLITLSLAGCGTDKTENTGSDPASTESGITATVTDSTAEPTAESSLPAGTESTTEYTTEKEQESSTAPADSGSKADAKPADTEPTALPKQTESPKTTEPPKQTEPPKVTEPPETKPTEPPTKPTEPQPTEPSFDIDKWIEFAKRYAESIGLVLDPEAVDCWDNPMIAGPKSKYLERDIKGILDRYKTVEGFSAVWIWAESEGNGNYRLFIGYA